MLERFGHGGDLFTAAELFGLSVDHFLDYSSNMNPAGPPAIVQTILVERWRELVRYPDPSVRKLRDAISAYYQVPKDYILVGNGAAELLDLAVRVVNPKCTAITAPSFVEYRQNAEKYGSSIHEIPLQRTFQFDIQMNDLYEALNRTDFLMLGHPNNPTGRLLPKYATHQLAKADTMILLDEAFLDFHPEEHAWTQLQMAVERPNWMVVRSMTKFFAIPGIRLGFIVAQPHWIEKMRALQVHWSVNHFAQLIGEAVLNDEDYILRTKRWTQKESAWFATQLRQLGFEVTDSAANYLLVRIPERFSFDAVQLQATLGRRGLLIRDASLFSSLDRRYFRLAVRLRANNQYCLAVLKEIIQ